RYSRADHCLDCSYIPFAKGFSRQGLPGQVLIHGDDFPGGQVPGAVLFLGGPVLQELDVSLQVRRRVCVDRMVANERDEEVTSVASSLDVGIVFAGFYGPCLEIFGRDGTEQRLGGGRSSNRAAVKLKGRDGLPRCRLRRM